MIPKKRFLWWTWAVVVAGIVALTIGVSSLSNAIRLHHRAKLANGEVVQIIRREGRGWPRERPLYVFEDHMQQKWHGGTEYTWRSFTVGERVPILYDPERPEISALEGAWAKWIDASFAIACGLAILLGVGIVARSNGQLPK